MTKSHDAYSDPHYDLVANLQPGKPDPSSKPSIDKLIDINHHLMRRVEELEEIVQNYMSREIHENLNRMKAREDS